MMMKMSKLINVVEYSEFRSRDHVPRCKYLYVNAHDLSYERLSWRIRVRACMLETAPAWTVVSDKTTGLLFLTLTRAIKLTWLMQIGKGCSSIYQKKKK
jgi:hypothetical protein